MISRAEMTPPWRRDQPQALSTHRPDHPRWATTPVPVSNARARTTEGSAILRTTTEPTGVPIAGDAQTFHPANGVHLSGAPRPGPTGVTGASNSWPSGPL